MATQLVREAQDEGGLGRCPALAPILWSDLPESQLGLASRNRVRSVGRALRQETSRHCRRGAASGPLSAPNGLRLRAYDRFASDLRRLSRDGRIRGGNDNVIDRQGLRPCPSSLATASVDLAPCITRVENGTAPVTTRSRPGQVNGRLGLLDRPRATIAEI